MAPKPITQDTIPHVVNHFILRELIANETVHLLYLDPPFNSNRNYNVLFKDENCTKSKA